MSLLDLFAECDLLNLVLADVQNAVRGPYKVIETTRLADTLADLDRRGVHHWGHVRVKGRWLISVEKC